MLPIVNEDQSLWIEVLIAKYGTPHPWKLSFKSTST